MNHDSPRPLYSVCITTYNRADTLGVAIQSALDQTYKNIEVIVINNGSTDNSQSVIEKYKAIDPRVRSITQNNQGMAGGRNAAFRAARGEYVGILDSDDSWKPEKVELTIQAFQKSESIGIVFSDNDCVCDGKVVEPKAIKKMYHNWHRFSQNQDLFKNTDRLFHPLTGTAIDLAWGMIFSDYIFGNLALPTAVSFRKTVFDRVGYLKEGGSALSEDFEFCLRVSRFFEIAFIDEALVNYTVGSPDQLSGGVAAQMKISSEYLAVFDQYLREFRSEIQHSDGFIRTHRAKTLAWVGSSLIENQHYSRARHFLIQSLKENPRQWPVFKMLVKTFVKPLLSKSD